jgi:NTE family protein
MAIRIRDLFDSDHRRRRPEIAFVLGGGGNLGAIQVGHLQALAERGVVPDVVIGCSVGALNAAAVAGNPAREEIDRLVALWATLTRNDVFPTSGRLSRGPWMFVRNGLSAYSNDGLRRVIDGWLRYRTFEDSAVPLWIVATSMQTGLEHWFHTGDVQRALLASTALPGFFPPVEIDGESFIDGGVVNNVPVSKAIELGAKHIFVLDVGNHIRERKAPQRPYEVLMHAVAIARAHRYRVDLDHVPEGVNIYPMPPIDTRGLRYDDFKQSRRLIDVAHRTAAAFLAHPSLTLPTARSRRRMRAV